MPKSTTYKFTAYFENEVLRKRPYLKKEWCIRIVENPIKVEKQETNRYRYWGVINEWDGRVLKGCYSGSPEDHT